MICPKCSGEWKIARRPWPFGRKRHVCSKCEYLDERNTWIDDQYVGPDPSLDRTTSPLDAEARKKFGPWKKPIVPRIGTEDPRDWENALYDHGVLPCCGSSGYKEGPRGALCTNIMCVKCEQKWNVILPGEIPFGDVRHIERI